MLSGIRVENVRELTRAISRLDKDVEKGLRIANRMMAEEVIARAEPKPLEVGTGRGATPVAQSGSASRNYVAIKAGGSWREKRVQPWGAGKGAEKREEPRPFILAAAIRTIPDIESRYLAVLQAAAEAAGIDSRRGV